MTDIKAGLNYMTSPVHYTKNSVTPTDTQSHSCSEDNKKAGNNTMFMNKYNINETTTDDHPILTPFQYLYPKSNHHAREVESHNFQKARLSVNCSSEERIFTFYTAL